MLMISNAHDCTDTILDTPSISIVIYIHMYMQHEKFWLSLLCDFLSLNPIKVPDRWFSLCTFPKKESNAKPTRSTASELLRKRPHDDSTIPTAQSINDGRRSVALGLSLSKNCYYTLPTI